MIDQKLPDPHNSSHLGYKIASLVQVYRLEDMPRNKWDDIFIKAGEINNITDRCLIYDIISDCLPAKYTYDKKRLQEEALRLIYLIPSTIDRLSRLEGYSSPNDSSNKEYGILKDVLKHAVNLTLTIEDQNEAGLHQRRIVDIADKIKPGFADELVELIDDDPARLRAKSEMKVSAEAAKAKREIANVKNVKEAREIPTKYLNTAARKNLAALLASRLETKSTEVMTEYVAAAGSLPLDEAFPVLAWHLENSARRYTTKKDISEHLQPLCEVLLLSTEMAMSIIARSSSTSMDMFLPEDKSTDGLILHPGSRDQAIQYIRQWLRINAFDYIKYCDPYFGPSDLEFLRLVLSECPTCKVSILTSKKILTDKKALGSEVFLDYWNNLVEQEPPETEIVAIGSETDEKILIHDRWILTKGAGLRI